MTKVNNHTHTHGKGKTHRRMTRWEEPSEPAQFIHDLLDPHTGPELDVP